MTRSMIASFAPMLAAAALFTSLPAAAQERSVQVHYAGLDLGNPAGVAELDHRIASAIKIVCGLTDAHDWYMNAEVKKCRAAATARVAGQRQIAIAQATGANNVAMLATPR